MFWERFYDRCVECGTKPNPLGQQIGISSGIISKWKTGAIPNGENLSKIADALNCSIDYLLGRTDDVHGKATKSTKKGVRIPVLGRVQAGVPVEAVEEVLDWEEITEDLASTGEFFALKVRGRSMEPKLLEGDVLIIRMQPDVDDGDIAVVMVNGDDATVKRIKKSREGVMLIPFNPDFEPMFYSNREIEEKPVRVIGRVIELRRPL